MTAIVDVATYLPRQVPLSQRSAALGLTETEVRRYTRAFGYDQVCYDPEQSEAQILLGAASKLSGLVGREHQVRYVLRPRSVRASEPYPMAPVDDVVRALAIEHAETFSLSDQVCATGLLALDTAGALLAEDGDPDALALVLVGEKTYGTVCQVIPGMAILAEGTAAVLVSAAGDRDRLLAYGADTVPIAGAGMTMGPEAVAAFGAVYADRLTAVVEQTLASAGLTAADLSLYLPHNTNRLLCVRTADRIGIDRSRVLTENIGRTAHCWGADPFINYRSAVDLGLLEPGDHYLMTSVGLGATFSAAVLRH